MTFTRFFGFGALLWILLAILKAVFLKVFNLDSFFLQVLFGFLVFVISMACARRLGFINYLEGALVSVVWTIGIIIFDFFILLPFLGWVVFGKVVLWAGYLLVALSIFLFHKKRHVQIRRELAAHHHGHAADHAGHKSHGDHSLQPHGHQEPGKGHH
jgi:hypothetical protein